MSKARLVFILLFAVVCGLAYMELQKDPISSHLADKEIMPFSNLDEALLKRLEISETGVVLVRSGDQWLIEDGVGTVVDIRKLNEYLQSFRELKAFPSSIQSKDLSIDPQAQSVTFSFEDDKKLFLQVSDKQTYDGKIFVAEILQDNAYVFNPEAKQLFTKSSNSFRNLFLFEGVTPSKILKVQFQNIKNKTSLTIVKENGSWSYQGKLLGQNKIINIISSVINFEAELIDEKMSQKGIDIATSSDIRVSGFSEGTIPEFDVYLKFDENRVLMQKKDGKIIYVTAKDLIKDWPSKSSDLEFTHPEAKK